MSHPPSACHASPIVPRPTPIRRHHAQHNHCPLLGHNPLRGVALTDVLRSMQNERTIDTTYTNNAQSMLGYVYHAAFWTATKVI